MNNKGSKKGLGAVLTVLAVLFGAYFISPADFSPAMLGIDDIGSVVALIASVIGAVKSFSDKRTPADKDQ